MIQKTFFIAGALVAGMLCIAPAAQAQYQQRGGAMHSYGQQFQGNRGVERQEFRGREEMRGERYGNDFGDHNSVYVPQSRRCLVRAGEICVR